MDAQTKPYDGVYITGIVLIAVSLLFFCEPLIFPTNDNESFGLFVFNYAAVIGYFIVLVINKRLKKGKNGLPVIFLLLVLSLISAWSLNRALPIFERSVPWLTVALVLCSAVYMSMQFFDRMPIWLRHTLCFLLGFSFVLFMYLTVYLAQLYPLGAVLALALGLSLHIFVPLLFVLFTIRQGTRIARADRRYLPTMLAGVAVPLTVAIIFALTWTKLNNTVKDEFQNSLIADNTDLPAWVRIAQNMPDNSLTEKYLKSDLVYSLPSKTWNWDMPSRSYNEARQHDPLVMFAALFSRPPALNQDERIKILESVYDARHKTLNRLRSGDKLETQAVITNARIWPESRIAYTEKTVTVFCNEPKTQWPQEREGIYTFYLPEGGVVTSLSLWINGKEEKARLSTRSKADSAYRTIVGAERRDPSLVHWQEGNTVSVRVFPILPGENRVFKIGVTAPLKLSGKELVYENIYFRGPDAAKATETIQVDWATTPAGMKMPDGFTANTNTRYIKKTTYNADWNLAFADPGIKQGRFSFDGHTYTIQPYKKQYTARTFDKIYLDVNKAWTADEVAAIQDAAKGKQLYVHNQAMTELGTNNAGITARLLERNFSILPVYEVTDNNNALIITKGTPNTPNIADLKETDFATRLERTLGKGTRYNVYCLDGELSPYMKTLKEHRVFNYDQGDMAQLKKILTDNIFPLNIESDSLAVVNNAGVALVKTTESTQSSAPDHLMRLFAYNHVMQQLGMGVFTNQEANDALVREAEQAYIVTPVSSMVVLETITDYNRFGIQESQNSLQNASMKSSGEVPEPEEWALIIIAACAILYTARKSRNKKATA